MTRSTLKPALLAVAAAIGLGVVAAAPAAAASEDHRPFTVTWTQPKVYDNAITGGAPDYVVFAGATAADWCAAGPTGMVTTAPATLRVQPDGAIPAPGTTDRYWLTTTVPVEVYAYTGGGVFDFLPAYCGALPEPLASGTGVLWVRGSTEYDGDTALRYENSGIRASLVGSDGSRVQVGAYSDNVAFLQDPLSESEALVGDEQFEVSVSVHATR